MQLTLWTYEGPPHIGPIRVATSLVDVHCVLHAPQGDTYADLLFTMIERRDTRPAVSYTTFQARDLGSDTAELVTTALRDAVERFSPRVLLVAESCTAELIQDQPGALAQGMDLGVPVVPLELPAYSKKENWGASETFRQLVRGLLGPRAREAATGGTASRPGPAREGRAARVNLLGPISLGFRCRDDVLEVTRLLASVGVEVAVCAPLGATTDDLLALPEADANVCLVPEIAASACEWLERSFGQPTIETVPIGVGATRDFLAEVGRVLGVDVSAALSSRAARLPWYSRSVDSTYLTAKRVFVFGDATHALAAARIADEEMGFDVIGLGTYTRARAREVRAAAEKLGAEAIVTDDYLTVEARIEALEPELVLGTQMERHIAKRLGIACAVISAPIHVQDFPARYSPQMGFEGANVIFDTWVHPLMMGLEEHLVNMFRDDFEFHAGATPSHLAAEGGRAGPESRAAEDAFESTGGDPAMRWADDARAELRKIPFFVRGKARRNTERFAAERGLDLITIETLYDAKAYFGR